MRTSVKLACCHLAYIRHHPTHWKVLKTIITVLVVTSILAPRSWSTHAAVAANLFWIWADPS